MKSRYKITIIATIVIFSILFVPPNIAAFSCNTLKIKDVNCHVEGMAFFGIFFPTSIYHWFEWDDPIVCDGIITTPGIPHTCEEGFADFWGYPAILSKYSDPAYHEHLESLDAIHDSSISIIGTNIDEDMELDGANTQCQGNELCLTEKIIRIIDGDTIYLEGDYKIRLSLTNTPERHELGFYEANQFTAEACPVGTTATVDQDDKQPYDMYDRMLGKVTCGNKVLNSELLYAGHANVLTRYCITSEFSDEVWAQEFGC